MNQRKLPSVPDWDLFCRVVDNFGDIGICWRLARILAARHGLAVRLWVDDWNAFSRLCPDAAASGDRLAAAGVEVRHWTEPLPDVEPPRVVVEAFGCELPPAYVAAMAARRPAPVWINLEYLSAEDWVAGCHGLASPHFRLPLVKHFFFPGFAAGTGGLLREAGLLEARERFQARPADADAHFARLGVAPGPDALNVSLFAYEHPAVGELLHAWADGARPLRLLVPEGRVVDDVARFFGQASACAGSRFERGALTAAVLPFLGQNEYDRLLWASDLNFVRGEDSFVRAQWAARPFVWQPYRQDGAAHLSKLEAFLRLHLEGLDERSASALRGFWRAWNEGVGLAAAWPPFSAALPAIRCHNRRWADRLASVDDLSTALVKFSASTVK